MSTHNIFFVEKHERYQHFLNEKSILSVAMLTVCLSASKFWIHHNQTDLFKFKSNYCKGFTL